MSEPSRRIQPIVSSLLELTGVALVIGGVYLFSPVAALILGGFATFFIGMAIDPPKREKGPEQ